MASSPLVASPPMEILMASAIAWMVSRDKGSALCTQCVGSQAVLGNVPQLVTVVAGPRWVLGLHTIQVHGLQVHSQLAAGGRGAWVSE